MYDFINLGKKDENWASNLASYNRILKHGAILYNEAEVFSLSITNPNGRPMHQFDWLNSLKSYFSKLPQDSVFFAGFLRLRNKFEK